MIKFFRKFLDNNFFRCNLVNCKGQGMLEFTFCMIVILIMLYSMLMIFRWVGVDLADRRIDHEKTFLSTSTATAARKRIMKQLDPYFHDPSPMNAVTDKF